MVPLTGPAAGAEPDRPAGPDALLDVPPSDSASEEDAASPQT